TKSRPTRSVTSCFLRLRRFRSGETVMSLVEGEEAADWISGAFSLGGDESESTVMGRSHSWLGFVFVVLDTFCTRNLSGDWFGFWTTRQLMLPGGVMRPLLSATMRFDGLLDLRFYRLHVEAASSLHRREFDEGFGCLGHFLLDVYVTPELVHVPVVKAERPALTIGKASSLEGVQAEIDQDQKIDFHCGAKPTIRLIGEAIFIVTNPHGTQRALGEIENLVALRGTFPGDQVHLVVAVEMHLVILVANLLARFQLLS